MIYSTLPKNVKKQGEEIYDLNKKNNFELYILNKMFFLHYFWELFLA